MCKNKGGYAGSIILIILGLICFLSSCSTTKHEPISSAGLDLSPAHEVFKVRSSLSFIRKTARVANCVVNLKSFQKEVELVTKFDFSAASGTEVMQSLLLGSCIASTYKTRVSPYMCKVKATTYKSDKKAFYINLRGCVFTSRVAPLVNTYVHECLHLRGYSHGSNSRKGKENSVNYKVGAIAQLHVKECYNGIN